MDAWRIARSVMFAAFCLWLLIFTGVVSQPGFTNIPTAFGIAHNFKAWSCDLRANFTLSGREIPLTWQERFTMTVGVVQNSLSSLYSEAANSPYPEAVRNVATYLREVVVQAPDFFRQANVTFYPFQNLYERLWLNGALLVNRSAESSAVKWLAGDHLLYLPGWFLLCVFAALAGSMLDVRLGLLALVFAFGVFIARLI